MDDHICEVCFVSMHHHDADCGSQEGPCHHFPPVCCPGCPCGSFEAAHNA